VVYPFWVTLDRLTVCVNLLCNYDNNNYKRMRIPPHDNHEATTRARIIHIHGYVMGIGLGIGTGVCAPVYSFEMNKEALTMHT
jgi:hypothetical protein